MSPTRSGYKELGLELVQLERETPLQHKQPPMAKEKRDDGAGDPIKMLLEKAFHVTYERDDGKLHLDPSTSVDGGRGTFNKQPFQRCDTLQGTS